MAVYTSLHKSEIQKIAQAYGLTVIKHATVSAGAANTNYLINTKQGDYMLTVAEDKEVKQIAELGELLLLLKQNSFPTTYPILTVNGDIVTQNNSKPVMVKKYIKGNIARDLSQKMLRQIGVAMAKLHQIPAPRFLSNRRPYGVQKYAKIQGRHIDPTYENWIAIKFSDFKRLKPAELPCGLVHGDIFYDNVIFDGDRLKAIIDFEEALYHAKIFDLGMGIVGTCFAGQHFLIEHARSLIQGYERVRKLEREEKNALKLFVEFAAVTVSCWRYWKYHIDSQNKEAADKHKQMMRMADAVHGIPQEMWLKTIFT